MYETPILNRVGKAEDVILGLVPTGNDIDGNYIVQGFEYGDEPDLFSPEL